MIQFFWGMLATLCFVAGLFFLKFWKTSRDRFFAMFGLAFWILALNWAGLAFVHPVDETRHYLYLVRLTGFVLIIAAILDKNRAEAGHRNR